MTSSTASTSTQTRSATAAAASTTKDKDNCYGSSNVDDDVDDDDDDNIVDQLLLDDESSEEASGGFDADNEEDSSAVAVAAAAAAAAAMVVSATSSPRDSEDFSTSSFLAGGGAGATRGSSGGYPGKASSSSSLSITSSTASSSNHHHYNHSSNSSNSNNNNSEKIGRWTEAEHAVFLEGLEKHGKQWKTIAGMIGTRTVVQVRTHAQKYFQKMDRKHHQQPPSISNSNKGSASSSSSSVVVAYSSNSSPATSPTPASMMAGAPAPTKRRSLPPSLPIRKKTKLAAAGTPKPKPRISISLLGSGGGGNRSGGAAGVPRPPTLVSRATSTNTVVAAHHNSAARDDAASLCPSPSSEDVMYVSCAHGSDSSVSRFIAAQTQHPHSRVSSSFVLVSRLSLPAFSASATSVSLENLSTISPSGVADFDDLDDAFLLYGPNGMTMNPKMMTMVDVEPAPSSSSYLGVVDSFPSDAAGVLMADGGASVATSAAAVTVEEASYIPLGEDPLEWLLENDSSIQQHLPESSLSAPMFPDFSELTSSSSTAGTALGASAPAPHNASDICYQSAGFVPLQPPTIRIGGILGHHHRNHHPGYHGTSAATSIGASSAPPKGVTLADVTDNLPYADPKVTVQSLFLVDDLERGDHEANDIQMDGANHNDDGLDVDMEEASALLLP
jgi:SHAQKYF class myb-like DNA-binding protein